MNVLFNTLWKHPAEGWSIASRAYARAMSAAGLDVFLRDWRRPELQLLDPDVVDEVGHLREAPGSFPAQDAHIFGSMLGGAADMTQSIRNYIERGGPGPRLMYLVFERLGPLEPELSRLLSRLDGIWVQCRANRDALELSGVRNATLFPYPLFGDEPLLSLEIPSRQPRVFYYIGRFEPRKSPDNVLRAFMRAFRPGEAELVMKISPQPHTLSEYTSPWEVVGEELGKNGWTDENWTDSIELIEGTLSRREMVELHARSDVYVSASRAEGLDLPCWEAKLAGRRVITTPSGGPQDFMGEYDTVLPLRGSVEADPCYPWGPGARYVDYDIDDLIAAMQWARSQPWKGNREWAGKSDHDAARVGGRLRDWIQSACSAQHRRTA